MTESFEKKHLDRRTLVKGAAWSVPVIATAVAAPMAAASGNVGAFHVNGTCGVLGVLGPGFTLTAGAAALPIGTTIDITGGGVANIGVFTVTGGAADVSVLGGTSRRIRLTAPLPAGGTLDMRTTLSISVAFNLYASVGLPAGYTATGSKPSGTVTATLVLCSAT